MQATSAFTFYYMFQRQHCNHCVAPCNGKSKYHHPLTRLLTLLSFHPRPPNEPPLPDNTAAKLNMVAIKAGAKKPGAKTQKVVPRLRQSRLVLVKETPPTVDEAIRPVERDTSTGSECISRLPFCPFNPSQIFFCSTPPHASPLYLCLPGRRAQSARRPLFRGEKNFFWGSFSWYTPISETPNPGGNPETRHSARY